MGRFVWLGDEYLNTDHVVSVSKPQADDMVFIELSDGRMLTRPSRYLDELVGTKTRETPTTA